MGRKNKPLTTAIIRRNSDELQEDEYCEEDAKSKSESTFLSGAMAKENNFQDETSAETPQPSPAAVTKHRPSKIEWVDPQRKLTVHSHNSRDESSDRRHKVTGRDESSDRIQKQPAPANKKYDYHAVREGFKDYAKEKNADRKSVV